MGVHRLFHLHLQGLRDHFGRLYEDALSDGPAVAAGGDMRDWDTRRRDAARDAHEGFERAAYASIPRICRHPDGELCDDVELMGLFGGGYVEAVRGTSAWPRRSSSSGSITSRDGLSSSP